MVCYISHRSDKGKQYRGATYRVFWGSFFSLDFFFIEFFWFVVAKNDLVNDVPSLTANSIWKSFLKY